MDFDRNAIGSLEDLQREWDGLETERAKVEDKLRSFEATNRGGFRGGRGGGRGGMRGNGFGGGRGHAQPGAGGGDWSRDRTRDERPRDDSNNNSSSNATGTQQQQRNSKQPYISREKLRAMSGTWERGLDPATAAADDDAANGGEVGSGDTTHRTPNRNTKDSNSTGDFSGKDRRMQDGPRSARDGKDRTRNNPRNDSGPTRGTRDGRAMLGDGGGTFSPGAVAGRGMARGGRQGYHDSNRGSSGASGNSAEPEAKRPRVTSTIVIAGHDDDGDGIREDGTMDRWDAGPGPEADQVMKDTGENGEDNAGHGDVEDGQQPEEIAVKVAGDDGDEKANGENADDQGRRPKFTSHIVVVPGTRGRAGRHTADGGVRMGRGGGVRGSMASRLGPAVGQPVLAKVEGADIDVFERPMPEPSKPELQAAYKDGDTKKRNRRMFGGLMAHLGRARVQLDHDQPMIEKQNNVAELAATRQIQEKRKQRQMAAMAARQERDEEMHKRDYINARHEKALVALHGNAFIANQKQLKDFIFTKALPKLAWTPNEHTDVTHALLTESNKAISASIAQRTESDDHAFKRIDETVAHRAAARDSRRGGPGVREQTQAGGADRAANPYGEGNEHRWGRQRRGEAVEDDGVERAAGRRKRGHDDADIDMDANQGVQDMDEEPGEATAGDIPGVNGNGDSEGVEQGVGQEEGQEVTESMQNGETSGEMFDARGDGTAVDADADADADASATNPDDSGANADDTVAKADADIPDASGEAMMVEDAAKDAVNNGTAAGSAVNTKHEPGESMQAEEGSAAVGNDKDGVAVHGGDNRLATDEDIEKKGTGGGIDENTTRELSGTSSREDNASHEAPVATVMGDDGKDGNAADLDKAIGAEGVGGADEDAQDAGGKDGDSRKEGRGRDSSGKKKKRAKSKSSSGRKASRRHSKD